MIDVAVHSFELEFTSKNTSIAVISYHCKLVSAIWFLQSDTSQRHYTLWDIQHLDTICLHFAVVGCINIYNQSNKRKRRKKLLIWYVIEFNFYDFVSCWSENIYIISRSSGSFLFIKLDSNRLSNQKIRLRLSQYYFKIIIIKFSQIAQYFAKSIKFL